MDRECFAGDTDDELADERWRELHRIPLRRSPRQLYDDNVQDSMELDVDNQDESQDNGRKDSFNVVIAEARKLHLAPPPISYSAVSYSRQIQKHCKLLCEHLA